MERLIPYPVITLPSRPGDAPSSAPMLLRESDRRNSIIEDTPGRIAVVEEPKAVHVAPRHAFHSLGRVPVVTHIAIIDREAVRYGVNPDLVRAIMYAENAQGALYGHPAEFIGGAGKEALPGFMQWFAAKSILPMNIRYDTWGRLGFARADFHNPELNIRAGVLLIRRILDRLEKPTVSKVATLYNSLAKDWVSDYGARVADVYRKKQWERRQ